MKSPRHAGLRPSALRVATYRKARNRAFFCTKVVSFVSLKSRPRTHTGALSGYCFFVHNISHYLHVIRNLDLNSECGGDHHIFTKDGVEEIVNLQPKGTEAKPYKVKQAWNLILILKYKVDTETRAR